MKCSEFEKSLGAFADCTLGPAERAAMEAHAAECPACRASLDETLAAVSALKKFTCDDPGELFWKRFNNKIFDGLEKPAAPARNIFALPAFKRSAIGLLTAASLLIAFLVFNNLQVRKSPISPAKTTQTGQSVASLPQNNQTGVKNPTNIENTTPPASNSATTPAGAGESVAANPKTVNPPAARTVVAKRKTRAVKPINKTTPAPAPASNDTETEILLAAAGTDTQIPHFNSMGSAEKTMTAANSAGDLDSSDIEILTPGASSSDVSGRSGGAGIPGMIFDMTDEEVQKALDSMPSGSGSMQGGTNKITRSST